MIYFDDMLFYKTIHRGNNWKIQRFQTGRLFLRKSCLVSVCLIRIVNSWWVDLNILTRLELFCAERLGNIIHCTLIFFEDMQLFILKFFARRPIEFYKFLCIFIRSIDEVLIDTTTMCSSGQGNNEGIRQNLQISGTGASLLDAVDCHIQVIHFGDFLSPLQSNSVFKTPSTRQLMSNGHNWRST